MLNKTIRLHNFFLVGAALLAFLRLIEVFYLKKFILTDIHYAAFSLAGIVVYLFPHLIKIRLPFDKRALFLIIALFLSSSLSLTLQLLFQQEVIDQFGFSSHIFLRTRWIEMFTWLALGLLSSRAKLNTSFKTSFLLLLLLFSIVFANLDSFGGLRYNEIDFLNSELALSHLTVAEHALLIVFIAFSLSPHKYRPFIIGLLVILLYELGGRSTLFFGVGTLIAFSLFGPEETTKKKSRKGNLLNVLMLIAAGGGVLFYLSGSSNQEHLAIMSFANGLTGDESFQARLSQFETGFNLLFQQLLFGNLGIVMLNLGSAGSAMHNVLSAWQLFGFPFLVLFIVALFEAARRIRFNFHIFQKAPLVQLAAILMIYSVFSLAFSKGASFWLAWYTLGLALGLKRRNVKKFDQQLGQLQK